LCRARGSARIARRDASTRSTRHRESWHDSTSRSMYPCAARGGERRASAASGRRHTRGGCGPERSDLRGASGPAESDVRLRRSCTTELADSSARRSTSAQATSKTIRTQGL
jgi:hypothetical protein